MKAKIISMVLSCFAIGAAAQETYESAQLATQDLNGTARYIGMGGAMEALGADISTMGTNPAGIGLFRRSWIGLSGGATIQNGNDNRNTLPGIGTDKGITNADLNQVGFVYSSKFSYNSRFNVGFNYTKSRNFNQIISAMNALDGLSSSNKLSAMRFANVEQDDKAIALIDDLNLYAVNDAYSDYDNDKFGFKGANRYNANRKNEGYIGEYDFNFSTNFNDRVYLGLTFGVKDVHYRSYSTYGEALDRAYTFDYSGEAEVPGSTIGGNYRSYDDREVTGTGFDLKFGAIIRPSEYSPFRFGLYMHTPTWYDLKANIRMGVNATGIDGTSENKSVNWSYDYRILTPWRFGISLGHTIGKIVAIGATYEYADYSSIKNRIKTNSYRNYWGERYDTYANDIEMNNHTSKTLKGVSLVKLGIEIKPSQVLAFRLGYNYQSAIYEENGYKDSNINTKRSDGQYYSTHDWINWKATNRFTFGMGFTFNKNWTLDLSYQYAMQKGIYHPFETYDFESYGIYNTDKSYEVNNNRHQINASVGYRF